MKGRRAVIDDLVNQYSDQCSTFTFKLRKGIPGQQIHKEGFINCYWSRKNKLVYMHVDKCGSTSLTTALRMQKPEFICMDQIPNPDNLAKKLVESNHTFFTMSRDPISRWISGLNEFMCRYKPPVDYVIRQVDSGKYVFDEHTAPQHLFLRLCLENSGNIVYLKLDHKIATKVNDLIKNTIDDDELKNTYKDLEIPHLRNSKYFIPNYTSICKKIYKTYIEKTPDKFNLLYKKDFEIYNNAI